MFPLLRRFLAPHLSMAAILLAGCGPVVVYDTRLQPVRDPLLLASVENGWLAIDSTASGVRGVLELWIETDARTLDYVDLYVPTLRCEAEGIHLPVRLRREEPVCSPPRSTMADCRGGRDEEGRCVADYMAGGEMCVRVVRAEFLFRHVPQLGEQLTLAFGQRATAVQWARR